ncbi:MAG TPA: helix-hairpin-helix domain-containing protein [Candidatus Acidoferrum sp.]|nr:helix-hairpin-helix domain-containing protein [Candidatus Acidoferrum sp.]
MVRVLVLVGAAALVALAIWHPAPQAPLAIAGQPSTVAPPRHARRGLPAATPGAIVYVVGAVVRPGLYHLADDARANDAVRAAGGFRPGADPAAVNLAAHASDGDEIFVPLLGESSRSTSPTKRARAPRTRLVKTHAIVDVNTASAQTLASVPGIGATVAARIVEIRARDGAFTTYDELLDVAGMTQSRLDRALPFLHL